MQNQINELPLYIQQIIYEIDSNQSTKIYSKIQPIEDDGLFHICESLRKNEENLITEINFSNNKIHDIGLKCLASILKNNKKLTKINLAENYIGSLGMKYLSEKLEFNKSLVYLNLNKNYIGSEGAKFLSEAIRLNKFLQEIELSSNNIKGEGVLHIFQALKHNNSIKSLNLSYNIIRNEGAKIINKLLPHNKSLKVLLIEFNIIEDEGLLFKINGVLERNKKIFEMNCSYQRKSTDADEAKGRNMIDKSLSFKIEEIEEYKMSLNKGIISENELDKFNFEVDSKNVDEVNRYIYTAKDRGIKLNLIYNTFFKNYLMQIKIK